MASLCHESEAVSIVLVSVAGPQHIGEERFSLTSHLPPPGSSLREWRAGAQGEDLEPAAEAEAPDECCLLLAVHGMVSLFPYATDDHGPTVALPYGLRLNQL